MYYVMICLPFMATFLITFEHQRGPKKKFAMHKLASEQIESEIFKFRARADVYNYAGKK